MHSPALLDSGGCSGGSESFFCHNLFCGHGFFFFPTRFVMVVWCVLWFLACGVGDASKSGGYDSWILSLVVEVICRSQEGWSFGFAALQSRWMASQSHLKFLDWIGHQEERSESVISFDRLGHRRGRFKSLWRGSGSFRPFEWLWCPRMFRRLSFLKIVVIVPIGWLIRIPGMKASAVINQWSETVLLFCESVDQLAAVDRFWEQSIERRRQSFHEWSHASSSLEELSYRQQSKLPWWY